MHVLVVGNANQSVPQWQWKTQTQLMKLLKRIVLFAWHVSIIAQRMQYHINSIYLYYFGRSIILNNIKYIENYHRGYCDEISGDYSMKIFDLMNIEAECYENRNVNVFYKNDLFKTRVIVLGKGQKIPKCQMDSFVMFYVVKGEVLLRKNDEESILKENQVFITEPAMVSMETDVGARLMGIQINTRV